MPMCTKSVYVQYVQGGRFSFDYGGRTRGVNPYPKLQNATVCVIVIVETQGQLVAHYRVDTGLPLMTNRYVQLGTVVHV